MRKLFIICRLSPTNHSKSNGKVKKRLLQHDSYPMMCKILASSLSLLVPWPPGNHNCTKVELISSMHHCRVQAFLHAFGISTKEANGENKWKESRKQRRNFFLSDNEDMTPFNLPVNPLLHTFLVTHRYLEH